MSDFLLKSMFYKLLKNQDNISLCKKTNGIWKIWKLFYIFHHQLKSSILKTLDTTTGFFLEKYKMRHYDLRSIENKQIISF